LVNKTKRRHISDYSITFIISIVRTKSRNSVTLVKSAAECLLQSLLILGLHQFGMNLAFCEGQTESFPFVQTYCCTSNYTDIIRI